MKIRSIASRVSNVILTLRRQSLDLQRQGTKLTMITTGNPDDDKRHMDRNTTNRKHKTINPFQVSCHSFKEAENRFKCNHCWTTKGTQMTREVAKMSAITKWSKRIRNGKILGPKTRSLILFVVFSTPAPSPSWPKTKSILVIFRTSCLSESRHKEPAETGLFFSKPKSQVHPLSSPVSSLSVKLKCSYSRSLIQVSSYSTLIILRWNQ